MNEMKALQWNAYQSVAYGIIAQSLQDLRSTPSSSASGFFDSEWFDILSYAINADPAAIRRIATRLPGFIDKQGRRSPLSDDARGILRGVHHRPVRVISPKGKAFVVHGSNGAANLIGCSRQAVSRAIKDGRDCMGWSFHPVYGGSK